MTSAVQIESLNYPAEWLADIRLGSTVVGAIRDIEQYAAAWGFSADISVRLHDRDDIPAWAVKTART